MPKRAESSTAKAQQAATLIRSLIRNEPVKEPQRRISHREREALRKRAEASELSTVPAKVIKRNLTECLKIALDGDPDGILDGDRIPLHRLATKIVREMTDDQLELWRQHRMLELVWDRTEGRVPDRLEHELNVRGVIALPVVTSSEMNWAADAVKVLDPSRTIDVRALPPKPSSNDDD